MLIVTGLPSEFTPARSTYNLDYANKLLNFVEGLSILYLRTFNPFRKKYWFKNLNNKIKVYECPILIPYIKYEHQISLISIFFNIFFNKNNFNVIQGIGGNTAIPARIISKKNNTPYFIHFIGNDINSEIQNLRKYPIYNESIKNSNYVGFESKDLKFKFLKFFNRNNNFSAIYRGIDISKLKFNYVLSEKIKIIFLGGFPVYDKGLAKDNTKGGYTLIEALLRLKQKDIKNFDVKICGPNTKIIKNELLKFQNSSIRVFDKGLLPQKKVFEELSDSNIVVIPSESEGLPNVLWQSLALGNLVIGSNAGGIPEILNINDCGVIFEKNNPIQLAEYLEYFSKNPSKIVKFAERGRQLVEKFTLEDFVKKNYKILKKI